MEINFRDNFRPSDQEAGALQKATNTLEEILGHSSIHVKHEWGTRRDEKGRPLYSLTISDWTGSKTAEFTLNDLKSLDHLRARLYRLWGELLQARVDEQLQKLAEDGK